jgi:3-methylcrotonyl-CoA carboxylase alpha subunit
VEHPVTEAITGLDLVEWQLRVAAGEPLPLKQNELKQSGHAIEVRLCAENPANQFLPETGNLNRFVLPAATNTVRIDTGFTEEDEVGVFYDSMIAKLIAFGDDRRHAIKHLQQALGETAVIGITTNIPFLEKIALHPSFAKGETTTAFVENHIADLLHQPSVADDIALFAAGAKLLLDEQQDAKLKAANHTDMTSPWNTVVGWRLNSKPQRELMLADPLSGTTHTILAETRVQNVCRLQHVGHEVLLESITSDGIKIDFTCDSQQHQARVLRHRHHLTVLQNGTRFDFEQVRPYEFESAEEVPGGRLTALMPGRIVKLLVKAGDEVKQGQPLLIMEAMKMEHTIHSPRDGKVARVVHKVDNIVAADALLFEFEQAAD